MIRIVGNAAPSKKATDINDTNRTHAATNEQSKSGLLDASKTLLQSNVKNLNPATRLQKIAKADSLVAETVTSAQRGDNQSILDLKSVKMS
jgi:hypothetical protein